MLNDYYTYIHLKANTDTVFYVGQGRGNRAYVKNDRNIHWHRTVAKYGYYVKLVHINLTKEQAAQHEIELIAHYKSQGVTLTNMTSGGDGGMSGYNHSEDAKKKIGEASKGNKYGAGNTTRRGTTHTEETKQKIKEKRALQVATWAGKPLSEETKEKLRQANLGKKMSAESSEKKRIAQTGSKRSAEAIAKTAAKTKGQKRTPEQREKMRLAQQAVARTIIRTPEEIREQMDLNNRKKRERRALSKLKNK